MTFTEQLIKTVLKEFILYLDELKSGNIMQKELDKFQIPSIHGDDKEKGVE